MSIVGHAVILFAGAASLVALSIVDTVLHRNPFSAEGFGMGLGTMIGGGGIAAWGVNRGLDMVAASRLQGSQRIDNPDA